MVAYKPMWRNVRAYKRDEHSLPHISAELLLVSTQYSFMCNS
jgi:hypothetical protein